MFTDIKTKVQERFNTMERFPLFVVEVGHDELYEAYLEAIPGEYRQEHTCRCCQTFLRNYGNIVAIDPATSKLLTLWDFSLPNGSIYEAVPFILAQLVSNANIKEPFSKIGRAHV